MDLDLLRALNPGRRFDQVGEMVLIANVAVADVKPDEVPKAGTVEVDKERRQVRALAKDGALLAVYPASIGSREKPAPTGTFAVRAIAENPTYTYNPAYAFRGVQAKEAFTIRPGPNNPVGTIWIDLTAETFGIHGTPEPAEVGKTASHGCVRLTNWDVEELARMVEKGTKVVFQERASSSRMSESR
jgi:lipoprotein-anchoring transpeptidase ErfK/SrfK